MTDATTPPTTNGGRPPGGGPGGASAFERLAPFIREFIWRRGWTEMREIQVRAAAAAFDTDKHILLASGTASGKTEAAFLPVLTQLADDPPAGVGALYIGPLKALINDQFLRLGDLCVEADIPVTAWHGDVAQSRKTALLRNPRGILQITPEALEGLLLNRSAALMRLFGDLRWVVIDEIHAFMASDRGGQVLSLFDRLSRYAADPARLPRRIGLSATLGDYCEAAAWLDGATGRGVEVVAEPGGRTVFLLVDHFLVQPEKRGDRPADAPADDGGDGGSTEAPRPAARPASVPSTPALDDDAVAADRLIARKTDLFTAAYRATEKRRSLIFTNSRGDAEEVITALRRLAERDHAPDIYHVHHGSIAAALREAAEVAMRDGEGPACTAATVTLELGIDLGQLDRVLQLGPTASVASFLQRLGRAGRRGQRPEMFFLLREEEDAGDAPALERVPWELLQTIALIQLYAEEKWIEPLARLTLPGSLLYQQTMSVVGAAGELQPNELAARVLTLAPFRRVSQDDFRDLLRHLVATEHLERTDDGALMLGLAGEKVVRNFRFLATFVDTTEWAVKEQARDIGTVGEPVPVGERLALAGRTWEVVDVVPEQRLLVVKRVRGSLRTLFTGNGGPDIHDRIVERMRRVLLEDVPYPYLSERAAARLADARVLARATGLAERPGVVPLSGDRVGLLPWCGTKKLRTMALRLGGAPGVGGVRDMRFYLEIGGTAPGPHGHDPSPAAAGDEGADNAVAPPAAVGVALAAIAAAPWTTAQLTTTLARIFCERNKFDPFLPDDLLKRSFVTDHLDVDGAAVRFRETVGPVAP